MRINTAAPKPIQGGRKGVSIRSVGLARSGARLLAATSTTAWMLPAAAGFSQGTPGLLILDSRPGSGARTGLRFTASLEQPAL